MERVEGDCRYGRGNGSGDPEPGETLRLPYFEE